MEGQNPFDTVDGEAIGWAEQYDDHGQAYYYNIQTQETKWELPDEENDGGYWKQLWDDHENSLFYQHTISGQMRWTLRDENEPNSEAEFSTPEFTSSPKDRKTYEHMNPAQRLTFSDVDQHREGVKIDVSGEDEDTNSMDDHGNQERAEVSAAIESAFASSVVSEGLSDDNKSSVENVHIDRFESEHLTDEKSVDGVPNMEKKHAVLRKPETDNSTDTSSSDEGDTFLQGEKGEGEKGGSNEAPPKVVSSEKSSSSSSESSDDDDDDDLDDDTVFYVYQCVFLFHGCAIESPAAVVEAAFRIVLHVCLVVYSLLAAMCRCFSDLAVDRIRYHLKEIMLYTAAALSLACCIPGGLVYRDFNSFKDDFDLLPIYTFCGRVDPRRFWVFTKGQGAEALNVVSKKFPEDSMDDYQHNKKTSKYKTFGRKSKRKRRKKKGKSSGSASKKSRQRPSGKNAVIELSSIVTNQWDSGNTKYSIDDEEEIQLYSDEEMIAH